MACLSFLAGCIENDIPFPVVEADIVAFEVRGQLEAAVIDNTQQTVKVNIADTVDMRNVRLLRFEVSNGAIVTPEITSTIDLTSPLTYTLTTYQEYPWVITGTQVIDRYIKVENQVGEAVFDLDSKMVLVNVASSTMLTDVTILDMKLGPAGSEILPAFSSVHDFTAVQKFICTYGDNVDIWSVRIVKSSVGVITGSANAYAKHALVDGQFQAGSGNPTFMYKKETDTEWITLPTTDVTVDDVRFNAKLPALDPQTNYIYKAVVGSLSGTEKSFTTEAAEQVKNSDFNEWCKGGTGDKSWFPDADLTSANYFWDSGNIGANTLGEKNPTMPEETIVISGKAAKLASTSVLGVFAAGSVYTGKFLELVGVSGAKLSFGIPFTSRPTALKGYYHYTPGTIDKANNKYSELRGKADTCHIYALVTDWTAPFEVNTSTGTFIDFKNNAGIIAMGQLIDGVGTGGQYKEFTLSFDYRSTTRKPAYILIVAAASKYGDFFTGSTSSVLYVDQFSLEYD